MTVRAADLVSVLPDAPAITAGSDHVVESLSPRRGRLFGTAMRPDYPICTTLSAGELVAAFDAAYRSGETTVVPFGVMSSVVEEMPSRMESRVSGAPVDHG